MGNVGEHELPEGSEIDDRYVVERKIGEGGFGAVYRARHKVLRQTVAMKVLRRQSSSAVNLQRFREEAAKLARLAHPHIVAIRDYGELERGQPYFVMDYVDGSSLHDLIRAGALTVLRTVEILSQICAAMGAFHAEGIIHRDLKPANIMVSNHNGQDWVRVLDFGIARDAAVQLTEEGEWLGSVSYMAPEQFEGNVSASSDLYALGVIAFCCLAGKPPFGGTRLDVALGHRQAAPPRLSEVSTVHAIPIELERLVASLLAKCPSDRPRSADDVRQKLRTMRVDEQAPVRPPERATTIGSISDVAPHTTPVGPLLPRLPISPTVTYNGDPAQRLATATSQTRPPAVAVDALLPASPDAQTRRPPSRPVPPLALVAAGATIAAVVVVTLAHRAEHSRPTGVEQIATETRLSAAPRTPPAEATPPQPTRTPLIVNVKIAPPSDASSQPSPRPSEARPVITRSRSAPVSSAAATAAPEPERTPAPKPTPTTAARPASPALASVQVIGVLAGGSQVPVEVWVDGTLRGTGKTVTLELRPGSHELSVRHGDRRDDRVIELWPGINKRHVAILE